LLPLSYREQVGQPDEPLPWDAKVAGRPRSLTIRGMWRSFLHGGYPELAGPRIRDVALWHASYVQTYLERDVRSLRQLGDLTQFQAFLRLLAAHSAQLLNLSSLARDLGVAVNT